MRQKTVLDLQKMKAENEKIAMITAYDASMARLVDEAGVEDSETIGVRSTHLSPAFARALDGERARARRGAARCDSIWILMDFAGILYGFS